jgi:hypothetical protein
MPTANKIALLAATLLVTPAAAATTGGSGALALAALIATHSPTASVAEKRVMARLFAGQTNFSYPANNTIIVSADSVVCRISNVDIAERSCELTFGRTKRTLKGREAHEFYATAVEIGVPSDGAAGTIYESFSHLICTIDPNAIKQKDGSGAMCMFDTGA